LALGCADIGEAVIQYDDGQKARSLITWGRNINTAEQHWHATKTVFTPVWCGSADGYAELILGSSDGTDPFSQWILAGLELTAKDIPWTEVSDG